MLRHKCMSKSNLKDRGDPTLIKKIIKKSVKAKERVRETKLEIGKECEYVIR